MAKVKEKSEEKEGKKGNYSYIPVRPKTHESIGKLSEQFSLSQIEFLFILISNIEKAGIDPRELEVQNPAGEIKKLRNTLVSFIRTQEKDVLLPMANRMDVAVSTLIQFMKTHGGAQSMDSSIAEPTTLPLTTKGKFILPSSPSSSSFKEEPMDSKLSDSRLLELEILSEKQEKEIGRLREKIRNVVSKISPKSFGSGYNIEISKDEVQSLTEI